MPKEIDILIGKKLSGNIDPAEDTQLQRWITESTENAAYYAEFEKTWLAAEMLRKNSKTDVDAAWNDFVQRRKIAPVRQITTGFYLRAAAAVIILLLAILMLRLQLVEQPSPKLVDGAGKFADTLQVPESLVAAVADSVVSGDTVIPAPVFTKKKKIKSVKEQTQLAMIAVSSEDSAMVFDLPDGTKVYLNTNSKLMYPENLGLHENEIYLSGEAYFETMGGGLYVLCHNTRTQVLAGALNIRGLRDGAVQIAAIDGKALVSRRGSDDARSIEISKGEQVRYDAATGEVKKSRITKRDRWWKNRSFRSIIREFFNRIIHGDRKRTD